MVTNKPTLRDIFRPPNTKIMTQINYEQSVLEYKIPLANIFIKVFQTHENDKHYEEGYPFHFKSSTEFQSSLSHNHGYGHGQYLLQGIYIYKHYRPRLDPIYLIYYQQL